MCRIDIVSKNLLANVFAIVAKEIIEKKVCKKITHKCRKNRKNNKCNKIQDLEREKAKKGPKSPQMSQNGKSNKDFSC